MTTICRGKIGWLLLLALCGGLYVRSFHPAPPIYDEAFYQALSDSIRQRTGYQSVWSPDPGRPRFPPGYPVFISGIAAAAPSSANAPYTASVVLTLGSLLILVQLFRKSSQAWIVSALFGTHVMTVSFSGQLMSEPLYIFLAYASLLLAFRSHETDNRSLFIGAFILALLSAFTRTIGWVLPACFLLSRLRKTDRREFILLSLLAIGAFLDFLRLTQTGEYVGLWSPLAQGERFAGHLFDNVLVHFGRNMADYVSGFWTSGVSRSASPAPLFALKLAASFAAGAIVLRGWWTRFRVSDFHLPEFFYAAYTLVCLGWEIYKFDYRLFLPILPLTLYYFVEGIKYVFKNHERPIYVLSLVLLALYLGRNIYRPLPSGRDSAAENFQSACAWLKAETPADAVVYSYAPAGVYLHAQRQSLKPVEWPESRRDWQSRPQYFLSDERFDDENGRFAKKAPLSHESLFATRDGQMRILRVDPPSPGNP